jgi:hypothetical protein
MNTEWGLVYRAMLYGPWIDESNAKFQIQLFEELDHVMTERHKSCRAWTEHWIDHSPLAHTVDIRHQKNSALSLAVEGGLFSCKAPPEEQFDVTRRKEGRPVIRIRGRLKTYPACRPFEVQDCVSASAT